MKGIEKAIYKVGVFQFYLVFNDIRDDGEQVPQQVATSQYYKDLATLQEAIVQEYKEIHYNFEFTIKERQAYKEEDGDFRYEITYYWKNNELEEGEKRVLIYCNDLQQNDFTSIAFGEEPPNPQ